MKKKKYAWLKEIKRIILGKVRLWFLKKGSVCVLDERAGCCFQWDQSVFMNEDHSVFKRWGCDFRRGNRSKFQRDSDCHFKGGINPFLKGIWAAIFKEIILCLWGRISSCLRGDVVIFRGRISSCFRGEGTRLFSKRLVCVYEGESTRVWEKMVGCCFQREQSVFMRANQSMFKRDSGCCFQRGSVRVLEEMAGYCFKENQSVFRKDSSCCKGDQFGFLNEHFGAAVRVIGPGFWKSILGLL